MRHSVPQVLARWARIAIVAILPLLAFPLAAGTLKDSDIEQLDRQPPVVIDCGSCTFIETFKTVPLQTDPNEEWIVLAVTSTLLAIGFIGIKFRVRVRQLKRAAH